MRHAILLAFAVLTAVPAYAGEGEAAKPSADAGDQTIIEMPMLVAPVSVNGLLYHYAYMRVQLKAASEDIARKARDKVPFILDAMLRETHRASIALNDDPKQIDGNGLQTRLLDSANAVMGAGSFVSLKFRDTIQTDDPAANAEEAPPAPSTEAAAEHSPGP